LNVSLRLRTEAFSPSRQMTLTGSHAGLTTGAAT
jgi:hypothetical protein